jgi:hypothetical protein
VTRTISVTLTKRQAIKLIVAANYGVEVATEGSYMTGTDALTVSRATDSIRKALYPQLPPYKEVLL